jgi:hypothetical protein
VAAAVVVGVQQTRDDVVVHMSPVWRAASNYIIRADIAKEGLSRTVEQLWAREVGQFEFELCCIPFFTYGLALGDRVSTKPDLFLAEVTNPSGRGVVRVWLGSAPDQRDQVLGIVQSLSLLFEWYSEDLLAIDTPTDEMHQSLLLTFNNMAGLVCEVGS